MKPIEILSSLPQWAKASPDDILSSPAWAMPCRLGSNQGTLRLGAMRPAETLDLAILIERERHVLGIAPSPAFPELGAIWASRAEVPEPILLALVEKDCGEFLQLLENAVRRQIRVEGIADASARDDSRTVAAQVTFPDDAPPIAFTLDISASVSAALGQLRNIDVSHAEIRDAKLPAEIEYATFSIPAAQLESLAAGDALLLPEVETMPPRLVAGGKFAVSESGVAEWKVEGQLHVCAAEASSVDMGTIFDAGQGGSFTPPRLPAENAPLRLVRLGKTLASGRFGSIAGQKAFIVG